MAREITIESPILALETIKELFSREAAFFCEPVAEGWRLLIVQEGRPYTVENLTEGVASETINSDQLGRVLAARREDLNGESKE